MTGPRIALVISSALIAATIGLVVSTSSTAGSALPVMLNPTQIGSIAVGSTGVLYFVDRQSGWIVAVTSSGVRGVLKGPNDVVRGQPSNLSPGIDGLSVTSQAIWYTANGELYKATLEGTDVKQVPAVFGATKVEAEENGSVFYATEGARYAGIYERLSSGKTTLFAGGPKATIDGTQQESGSLPAMSVGLVPLNFATGSNGDLYIANYEHEQLDLVANGIFRQITSGGGDWHAAQVASGPNGSVYGIGTDVMDRIDASAISSMFVVPQNINVGFFGYAGMAVSPGGSIYVSYYSQDSGESEQSAIVRYSSSGQATVVVFAGHPCYWLNVEKQSARPFQIPPSAISLPKTVGCSPKVSEY